MLVAVTILVVLAVAVAVGVWVGNLGNRDTPRPADSRPSQECEQACNLFQIRQEEACLAGKAEKAAKDHVDLLWGIIAALLGLTGVIAAALIGAWASTGFVLTPIVIVIALGVSLIVAAIAVTMFSALVTAALILSAKRQEAIDATSRRSEARIALLAACTSEQANQCLSIPFTC